MTPRARGLVGLALLLVLAVPLAACGKKALPEAPPGEPNTYPRIYPSQ